MNDSHGTSQTGTLQHGTLQFNDSNERRFQELLTHYPTMEAALIPALHLAQDQFGYLSDSVLEYVAQRLSLPVSKALSVTSFYTMLRCRPQGTHNIQVCRTLSCALAGSEALLKHLETRLGIHSGDTTPDGKFTLTEVECLASCGTAPVIQVNNQEFEEQVTHQKADELLRRLNA